MSCNVPLYLEQICVRALEKDPRNRFESAKAMKKALEHYLDTFKNEENASGKEKNSTLLYPSLPNIKYSHTTQEEIVRTPACIERVPENPTLLRPVPITSMNHSNLASSIQKMSPYSSNMASSQSHMMKPKPAPVPNRHNEVTRLETTKLRSGRKLEDEEPTQLDSKITPEKLSSNNLNSDKRIGYSSAEPLSRETKRYNSEPKDVMRQEDRYRGSIKPGPVPKDSNKNSMRQEDGYRGSIKPGPVPKDSTKPGPVPKDATKPGPVPKDATKPGPVPKDATKPGSVPKDSTKSGSASEEKIHDILSDEIPTVVDKKINKFSDSHKSNKSKQNFDKKISLKQNDPVTLFDLILWGCVFIIAIIIISKLW